MKVPSAKCLKASAHRRWQGATPGLLCTGRGRHGARPRLLTEWKLCDASQHLAGAAGR